MDWVLIGVAIEGARTPAFTPEIETGRRMQRETSCWEPKPPQAGSRSTLRVPVRLVAILVRRIGQVRGGRRPSGCRGARR